MSSKFEIETGRLILSKPTEEDFQVLQLILTNPLMTMYREFSFDDAEIHSLILDSEASLSNGGVGLRLIQEKNTKEVIGFGGIKRSILINTEIYAAFMYLVPHAWGLGYGKEALAASINEAFDLKGIDKIHSFIGLENYSMQYLLEALGFLKIGDETINLDYNVVTRAHYILEKENKSDILLSGDNVFFPLI